MGCMPPLMLSLLMFQSRSSSVDCWEILAAVKELFGFNTNISLLVYLINPVKTCDSVFLGGSEIIFNDRSFRFFCQSKFK